MSNQFDVFLEDGAIQINIARMQHLASLNLDIAGKRVLEVGAGIGLLTSFFEAHGCSILSTDGRIQNVLEHRRRFPHRCVEVLDLEVTSDLTYLGEFDVVFCYGTLYHLKNPGVALKSMADVCRDFLLLETCVTPGAQFDIYLVAEDPQNPNQAFSGIGCRPSRPWIMQELQSHFGHAYLSRNQPCHEDFDLDWKNPSPKKLHRSVFVGSRISLINEKLSDVLLEHQAYEPMSQRVWIDVGAHLGQTTFSEAEKNPLLTIYAFEPNISIASQLFLKLPNYVVIAAAISSREGLSEFYLNQFEASSSLLPFVPGMVEKWIGGEQLKVECTFPVPTLRLDTIFKQLGWVQIEYLKIDAQGGDFDVILSLGDYLQKCIKIQLEVTVTESQIYLGASTRTEIIQYLADQNFLLVDVKLQSYDQEENLVFVRKDSIWTVSDINEKISRLAHSDIISVAQVLAFYYPLELYPGWSTNANRDNPNSQLLLRQAICKLFREQNVKAHLCYKWYNCLKLSIDLSSELGTQIFINGTYEPNVFYHLSRSLSKGMTFLDIGAGEGFHTLLAASILGKSGLVLAFESKAKTFQKLQDNIALNLDLEDLAVIRVFALAGSVAVGKKKAEEIISDFPEHQFHCQDRSTSVDPNIYPTNPDKLQVVELEQLDSIVASLGLQRIDVIRINFTEETLLALQKLKNSLNHFQPLLFLKICKEFLDSESCDVESILEALDSLGYKLFKYGEFTALPLPLSFRDGAILSEDLIAIHPERTWEFLTEVDYINVLQRELELSQIKLSKTDTELEKAIQKNLVLQDRCEHLYVQMHELEEIRNKLEGVKHGLENQIHSVQTRLASVESALAVSESTLAVSESTLAAVEQARQKTADLLEVYQNQVAAMESSKFWRLRNGWVALKRRLGLLNEDEK